MQGCMGPMHRAHCKISLQYPIWVLVYNIYQPTAPITDKIVSVKSPSDDEPTFTCSIWELLFSNQMILIAGCSLYALDNV